jgi:hypothetical protein
VSDNPIEETVRELLPYLEDLETQSGAILEFLKDKGHLSDEEFAPYLQKAAEASSVKWRAARVRLEYLFSLAQSSEQQSAGNPPEAQKHVEEKVEARNSHSDEKNAA